MRSGLMTLLIVLSCAISGCSVLGMNDQPAEKHAFRDCQGFCPEMVSVPAGEYEMGADRHDKHHVAIKAFALSRSPITRGEFARFVNETDYDMGDSCNVLLKNQWWFRDGYGWRNPGFAQDDDEPVVCVSWKAANAYAQWLSARTGQHYYLPSEAQWEYVATYNQRDQAGGKELIEGAENQPARSPCDAHCHTLPVYRSSANALGLYDVLGNVYAWTEDCIHSVLENAPNDGSAWLGTVEPEPAPPPGGLEVIRPTGIRQGDCVWRMYRGISFATPDRFRNPLHRGHAPWDASYADIGLRVAREMTDQ